MDVDALRQYVPLVRRLAGRLINRLPANVEIDDLIQAGMLGLLTALSRFDASQGVPFEGYAVRRIHGAMLDELRAGDWMSRGQRRQRRGIDEAEERLRQRLGRRPTEGEMAAELGLPLAEYQEAVDTSRGTDFVYLDEVDEEIKVPDTATLAVDALEQAQIHAAVAHETSLLPEREQHVVAAYYAGGETLAAIGERLGVTESRVCQLHAQAVRRLRRRLAWAEPAQRDKVAPLPVDHLGAPVPDDITVWSGTRWG